MASGVQYLYIYIYVLHGDTHMNISIAMNTVFVFCVLVGGVMLPCQ